MSGRSRDAPAPGYEQSVDRHYGDADLCARILSRLREAGKDVDRLTRDDLAPFDEFHGGGRESTRELARLAGLRPGLRVLDAGSGVGGPARTLAAEFGCRVTGIDLTREFCRAAEMLTERTGLTAQVDFRCGNMLELPFGDAAFDVVWSQNTLMNIDDKAALFREFRRVLRPGGLFVFETVMAGEVPGIHFPVFWAETAAISFLATPAELKRLLASAGFSERCWDDTTQRTIAAQRKRRELMLREGPAVLSLGVIVPNDAPLKMGNGLKNNEEGRTLTAQAVYARACAA
jgi:ubiquinone/menaquinone biosynthesis C-methylase UbiE